MRSMMIAAAVAIGGFAFAAAPAQAGHDFQRGFERQMGRIVANHVAGVAQFAFVHGYGHRGYYGPRPHYRSFGAGQHGPHRHHGSCGHRVAHHRAYPRTDRHHHGGGHGGGYGGDGFRSRGDDHGYGGRDGRVAHNERQFRH